MKFNLNDEKAFFSSLCAITIAVIVVVAFIVRISTKNERIKNYNEIELGLVEMKEISIFIPAKWVTSEERTRIEKIVVELEKYKLSDKPIEEP
jgi:hypothetical protein